MHSVYLGGITVSTPGHYRNTASNCIDYNRSPDNYRVAEIGDAICYASKNIPHEARQELRKTITPNIEDGARVYLERGGVSIPAIIISDDKARLVDIDGVGKHHLRKQTALYRHYTVREAVMSRAGQSRRGQQSINLPSPGASRRCCMTWCAAKTATRASA